MGKFAMDLNCCGCIRNKKPKVVKQCLDKIHKCANVACVNTTPTDLLYKWRPSIAGNNIYRFCSDNCWSDWLFSPIQTRPLIIDTSPVTPAITPYTRMEDIPMLDI